MSSSPNEFERSLLQKAVRRGNENLVEKVVNYLTVVDDQTWLKNRLVVMAYEECWMYAKELILDSNKAKITGQYKSLSRAVKNKNAAGLASLAIKFTENAKGILINDEKTNNSIRSVALGIENINKFWELIVLEPGYNDNKRVIEITQQHIKKASFPEDKAMLLSAAYLSVKYPTPEIQMTEPSNDKYFPYWIAIDKHTSAGKEKYFEACREIKLDSFTGMQLGFYMEGSLCNQMLDSPYWEQMKLWQLKNMGFTLEQAVDKWGELKPLIIKKTKNVVENMIQRIEDNQVKDPDQFVLFG
ncbi:MAG: hypothetical protein IH620_00860 [Ignavibacterium sp.]|nr:hypothetical protein [Ignavibacterium sp.]